MRRVGSGASGMMAMDGLKNGYSAWAYERYESLYESDVDAFFSIMDRPLAQCVRINTLCSSATSLFEQFDRDGIAYEEIGEGVGARVTDTPFSLSSMPSHLMGHFYIQGLAEMAVAPQLVPVQGSLVWDMCAAPGGKTTHLSQLMGDTGAIMATDVSRDKISALCNNVARMGCTNTLTFAADARSWRPPRPPDAILLDAPCTGSGTMRKDPTRKHSRSYKDVMFMQGIQKGLITQAARELGTGGLLLYATCSLEPEENECVVDWALKTLPLSILPLAPTFVQISPGYSSPLGMRLSASVELSGRVHPHKNDSNGMFMALFERLASS